MDKRHRVPVGMQVKPNEWDSKKQKLKPSSMDYLNRQAKISEVLNRCQFILLDNPGINKDQFKIIFEGGELKAPFMAFMEKFVERKNSAYTKSGSLANTNYSQTVSHLTVYEEANGPLDFNSFTYEFYDLFHQQMIGRGYALNTFGKHIGNIKTVLNAYEEDNPKIRINKKALKVVRMSPEDIYLSEANLDKIKKSQFFKAKRRVADILIVLCWTGARYKDYKKIKWDLDSDLIFLQPTKTASPVSMPIHPDVRAILLAYEGLPAPMSNPKFNREVKIVCEWAGIDDLINIPPSDTHRLKKYGTDKVERWKMVSSHTGRRSLATNLVLQGQPIPAIMSYTGHKTYKDFMTYLKMGDIENIKMVRKIWDDKYS